MTEPRHISGLLADVQRSLARGRPHATDPVRYRLRGWWLRAQVRFWLALERYIERRLRRAFDRLCAHDAT